MRVRRPRRRLARRCRVDRAIRATSVTKPPTKAATPRNAARPVTSMQQRGQQEEHRTADHRNPRRLVTQVCRRERRRAAAAQVLLGRQAGVLPAVPGFVRGSRPPRHRRDVVPVRRVARPTPAMAAQASSSAEATSAGSGAMTQHRLRVGTAARSTKRRSTVPSAMATTAAATPAEAQNSSSNWSASCGSTVRHGDIGRRIWPVAATWNRHSSLGTEARVCWRMNSTLPAKIASASLSRVATW